MNLLSHAHAIGTSVLLVSLALSLSGCRKKANVGPPAKTLVEVDSFDGQKLAGRLTLTNAAGGEVAADGKLTLTLITDRDLCSASTDVHKSSFVPSPGDPSSTHLPLSLSMTAPCPRPAAGGAPMNLRVTFEAPEGVRLQALEVVRVEAFTPPALNGQSRDETHENTKTAVIGFTPGSMSATVTIIDVAKKTIACRGYVSARSSSDITASGGETLAIDLHDNFEKAMARLETTIAKAPLR